MRKGCDKVASLSHFFDNLVAVVHPSHSKSTNIQSVNASGNKGRVHLPNHIKAAKDVNLIHTVEVG